MFSEETDIYFSVSLAHTFWKKEKTISYDHMQSVVASGCDWGLNGDFCINYYILIIYKIYVLTKLYGSLTYEGYFKVIATLFSSTINSLVKYLYYVMFWYFRSKTMFWSFKKENCNFIICNYFQEQDMYMSCFSSCVFDIV